MSVNLFNYSERVNTTYINKQHSSGVPSLWPANVYCEAREYFWSRFILPGYTVDKLLQKLDIYITSIK
jgi:hypothetical protein